MRDSLTAAMKMTPFPFRHLNKVAVGMAFSWGGIVIRDKLFYSFFTLLYSFSHFHFH